MSSVVWVLKTKEKLIQLTILEVQGHGAGVNLTLGKVLQQMAR